MLLLALPVLLLACEARRGDQALGALEWDRIELVATAAEPVVSIDVLEGQRLSKGDRLLQLDPAKALAELKRLVAVRQQSEARLAELIRGPREEEIAEARARLEGAKSRLWEAEVSLERTRVLAQQKLTSKSGLDVATTSYKSARAGLNADREVLRKLVTGTTREQLEQAESVLDQSRAAVDRQQLIVADLSVHASRDGVLDSLPYKVGERPPIGAVLAVILAGPAPYARVYISELHRLAVKVGDKLVIHIDGLSSPLTGTVRRVSSDPVFTPYFALSERDRGRLAYVVEVILPDGEGADLPAGIPVQVDLPGAE